MLRTTLFKGVKGQDSVRRRCLRARSAIEKQRAEVWGGAPADLEPRRCRRTLLSANCYTGSKKDGQTRRQIGFIAARCVANFGTYAAPMTQFVAYRGANESWLIGFSNAYNSSHVWHP
jgi:hypothetical protein